jgi:hypothetical protein
MAHVIRIARLPVVASIALVLALIAPQAAAADALVVVKDLKLERSPHRVVVKGRIVWNAAALRSLSIGEVRLVGISRTQHRPTVVLGPTVEPLSSHPATDVEFALKTNAELTAVRPGNRVVLTATQHAPNPSPIVPTALSYVTVGQVRAGPPRGRIGREDCSDRPVRAGEPLMGCDLVGAYLMRAQVGSNQLRTSLETADLSGADLRQADISRIDVAGGRLNGANATGAKSVDVSFRHTEGVGFIERDSTIVNLNAANAHFVDADFHKTTFTDTPTNSSFFTATLDGADFGEATLEGVNLVTARLVGADLRGATLTAPDVYFADLTRARLGGAIIDPDPAILFQWSLLCGTEMPAGGTVNRDCKG